MAMLCPTCGAGVPDGRAKCQVCGGDMAGVEAAKEHPGLTPHLEVHREDAEDGAVVAGIPGIDNQPQPVDRPAANPLQGGEVRVSLTGEVIEVPPPQPVAKGPGGYAPGGPPRPAAGPASGAAPPRPAPRPTRMREAVEEEDGPKKSGSTVLLVVLVLVIAAIAGGFWYVQQQHAPASAVEAFFDAYKAKDWKTVYSLLDVPSDQKALATEELVSKQLDQLSSVLTVKDVKTGEVTNQGDTATVKTTITLQMSGALARLVGGKNGEPQTSDIAMKKVDGKWKVDSSGFNKVIMSGGSGGGNKP